MFIYWNTIQRYKESTVSAMTWMNLKDIMLSERNQMQKTTYYMSPFNAMSRKGKCIYIESRLVVA